MHHFDHIIGGHLAWQVGSVGQDHRQAKSAGGIQLGPRAAATGVFGDHMGDRMGAHQRGVTRHVERTPRQHDCCPGQRQRALRRIDEAFPPQIRSATRDGDMSIRLANGSVWQVLGSDNYDSLVGAPPVGVVFSEWALAKPDAWTYIRPILAENGGWALFLWTPRGRNHAVRAFEARARDGSWFTLRSPATETGVFTPAQLARERAELVAETGSKEEGEARFASEYLVDFDAAAPGAYYAALLADAQSAGRVGHVPYDPGLAVHTAWLYRRIFTYCACGANFAGLAAIILRLDDPVALKWLGLALIGANIVLGTLYLAGATVTDWAKLVAAGRRDRG